jgi:hypothetical protein
MHRLLTILSIITLNFANSAYSRGKLEVTEMKGGSVMTDQLSGQRFDKVLKWFVINDPSSPVRLENTGITTSQHEAYYGCFRNLLLVTGRQLLFATALARDFELPKITEAKFGCNLLVPKPLH